MRKCDLIFFLSGAAALVDQVVWSRLAGRVLGSDTAGVTLVLAVFMAGLGGGALLFAKRARAARSPVLLFLTIQLFVAIWAGASAYWLSQVPPLDGFLARAGFTIAWLLPPTLGMGATFPLMGRLSIRERSATGQDTASFYGANTIGAATGALAAPFLLMPILGLSGALLVGAGLDALAGLLAFAVLRAPEREENVPPSSGIPFAPELGVTCMLGFTALALEVLLTRLLISVTGASVFAFAIVLSVFLLGIGYGSRLAARRTAGSPQFLGRLALAVAPVTLAGLLLLEMQLGESSLFAPLANRAPQGASFFKLWLSHALFAALALLGPALCFGAALPTIVERLVARDSERTPESWLAWTYGYNTLGALGGALLAGLVLLPALGLAKAVAVALAVALAAGWICRDVSIREKLASSVLAVALFSWLAGGGSDSEEIIARSHGPFSSASVSEGLDSSGKAVRSLRVNGKVVATSVAVDLRLQRLLAHIPAHLHGEVESALVIGLGTGMTAGSLLDLPTLKELHIFEISSAVRDCAPAFARWNGDVLEDARTNLLLADGRHALARSERTFDLITSDPIHPWTRGSSDLYSLQHFEQMAAHLSERGVASQWLPLYQLSTEDVKTVIATWCAAFPHTSAWITAYDLALVGSRSPLPGPEALVERDLFAEARPHLAEAGIRSGLELAALHVAGHSALRELSRFNPPMLDDSPTLEFSAPFSYLEGYSVEILAWCAREDVEGLPEAARPRAAENRALLHEFLTELPSGLSHAVANYGEKLLALPPADE